MKKSFLLAAFIMLLVTFNFTNVNAINYPAPATSSSCSSTSNEVDKFLDDFDAFNDEFEDAVNKLAVGDISVADQVATLMAKGEKITTQIDQLDEEKITPAQEKRAEQVVMRFVQIYQKLQSIQ